MAAPELAPRGVKAVAPAHWRWPLIALCLAVLSLLAAQVLLHGPMLELDQEVSNFFAVHRHPGVTALMSAVSRVHQTVYVLSAAALVAAACAFRRDWRAAAAVLVVPTGMLLNVGLKNLFHRARPAWKDPLVQLATYSFPSGHAVASTVFYGMLCALVFSRTQSPLWRAFALAGAVTMILLVCFSRVYLGAHYPGDVLGGVALGTACVLLFLRLLRP